MNGPESWQEYEEVIAEHFRSQFPEAVITKNAHVLGRYSKISRQVDLLVDGKIAGFQLRIAIDAKFRSRPADVADVEAFVGFCEDVGASKGVLITLNGFSEAAAKRAYNDSSDVELDVLNFKDLGNHQGLVAIPFSGSHAVLIAAPFGWIVDATGPQGTIATLYQRGRDLAAAVAVREWMYINLWHRNSETGSLDGLIAKQEGQLRSKDPTGAFEYQPGPFRNDTLSRIRVFRAHSYPAVEVTGFLEFQEFIFFCVLFTPEELLSRNLRKLEDVLRSAVPMLITHSVEQQA